jgi:hypothetical protein
MWLNLEGKVGCGVEKYKSIETGKPILLKSHTQGNGQLSTSVCVRRIMLESGLVEEKRNNESGR